MAMLALGGAAIGGALLVKHELALVSVPLGLWITAESRNDWRRVVRRGLIAGLPVVAAALVTLFGAVLLVRSATKAKPEATRYERRGTPSREEATAPSERAIWDALDEGRDLTDPDNKGR